MLGLYSIDIFKMEWAACISTDRSIDPPIVV